MKPASPERHNIRGFTLVETLVVMAISVGLVVLMAGLFRTVGHATVALRGLTADWSAQRQLRQQLLFVMSVSGQPALMGTELELHFMTWRSDKLGLNSKPVVATYRCDPDRRTLSYTERPMAPWWNSRIDLPPGNSGANDETGIPILTGVSNCTFRFLAEDAQGISEPNLRKDWRRKVVPKLIVLRYGHGSRQHELFFDARAIDA